MMENTNRNNDTATRIARSHGNSSARFCGGVVEMPKNVSRSENREAILPPHSTKFFNRENTPNTNKRTTPISANISIEYVIDSNIQGGIRDSSAKKDLKFTLYTKGSFHPLTAYDISFSLHSMNAEHIRNDDYSKIHFFKGTYCIFVYDYSFTGFHDSNSTHYIAVDVDTERCFIPTADD